MKQVRNITRYMRCGARAFLLVALLCGLVVPPAYATPSLPSVPGVTAPTTSGNAARSGDLETVDASGGKKKCSDYGVLTGAMVPCIMNTLETSGQKLAEEFSDMLKPVVHSFLVLAVIFFGVKVLQGEGQIGARAFAFVLKIGFVLAFLQIFPSLIPQVHAIMRESNQILSGLLVDPSVFHCEVSKYLKPGGELLWAQMDCVLGKLFGFTVGSGGQPNMLLAASGLGMLGGFMFGGAAGFFVFFAILGVLFSLFMFVMKTMLAYVNGFIVATLLIIIAPIFLPLALMPATAQYFDKWWKGILAAMLMPVIVTGYVILALMLYDHILLRDDSTVKKIFNPDFMQTIQVMTEQSCGPVTGNSQNAGVTAAQNDATTPFTEGERAEALQNLINPSASGNNVVCVDHPGLRAAADDLEKWFIELVKLLITTIVIGEGFKVIQQTVRNVTGSSMVSSALDPVSTLEQKTSQALQSAKQGMEYARADDGQMVRNMRGADFVRNIPDALQGGVSGFMGQITRTRE